ncbi:MAG: hypothetical protein ACTSXA_11985 [Candidatus Heimdallarchaeota archaeon]
MSNIQPPNVDEIKRQSVLRFLSEMQVIKQKIELEFSSRFDEQKNNFLATSKASYSPAEIGTIFDTIKNLEMDYMRNILSSTSQNGSSILGNTLGSALTGNLSFTGETTQRIAELEQENNVLKAQLLEKQQEFSAEQERQKERGEGRIGEVNKLQEQVDEQGRTIEVYEKQVMDLGETLAQQRIEIEDLQTQIGDTSIKDETIEEQKKTIAALNEQQESLEKRISQMKGVSAEKYQAETSQLEKTVKMERERADDLEVRSKESAAAVESYKKAIEQKDEEIDKLRKTVTDAKSEVATSSTEKDALIKQLQDDLKANNHQLTDTKASLDRTKKKVEGLTSDLGEKEKAVDTKDEEIRNLKSQLTDIKESISSEKSGQEAKLQDLLKEKTRYEAEINELKTELRDVKTSMSDKEKTINEISKTQDVVEKDRIALQEERDKTLVQLENLKSRLSELEATSTQKDSMVKSLTKSLQGVPKFRVFLAIQDIGGDIAITDLAKIVGQSKNVVDHIVSDLKEDGLVITSKKENKTFVSKV